MDPLRINTVKMILVGDGMVGKTSLLTSFTTNTFNSEYMPTIFESTTFGIEVDNKPYTLTLWDTAGQEEYKQLRQLSYPETDVFILCFALDIENSFNNVPVWRDEVKNCCPESKLLLVGTKSDLRNDKEVQNTLIRLEKGKELALQIGAFDYKETSAMTQTGLRDIFEDSVRAVFNEKKV